MVAPWDHVEDTGDARAARQLGRDERDADWVLGPLKRGDVERTEEHCEVGADDLDDGGPLLRAIKGSRLGER